MYLRKVKKAGKTYLYYYKSQRIGSKVKSIYVGRALEKPKKTSGKTKAIRQDIKKTDVVNKLFEFDNLLFEINKLMAVKDLKGALDIYNKIFNLYSELSLDVEDKQKLFNRLSSAYEDLLNLSKEHKITE
ncbi:MAG: hypothetical protein AABW56_02545 [Nanoarchaeota archaeon]